MGKINPYFCLSAIFAIAVCLSCQQNEVEEQQTIQLSVLDDLSRFDSIQVVVIPGEGNPRDTLHPGKVNGQTIPAIRISRYSGGDAQIEIIGFAAGFVAFRKVLFYNATKQRIDSTIIALAPPDFLRLSPAMLRVPVKGSAPLPKAWLGTQIMDRAKVVFKTTHNQIAEVRGDSVFGLVAGSSELHASLSDIADIKAAIRLLVEGEPTVKGPSDSPLVVTPVKSIRLTSATKTGYIGGPEIAFTLTVDPVTATNQIILTVKPESLAVLTPEKTLRPIQPGRVTVWATSKHDTSMHDSMSIALIRDIPRVNAGNDTVVGTNSKVVFKAQVTQDFGTISTLRWNFGEDSTWDFTSSSVIESNHIYAKAGIYFAHVSVIDGEGNEGMDTCRIRVVDGPVVQIHSPKNGSYWNKRKIPVVWTANEVMQKSDTTAELSDAINILVRSFRDDLGRIAADTVRVFFDETPPPPPVSATSRWTDSPRPVWAWTASVPTDTNFRICDKPDCSGFIDTVTKLIVLDPSTSFRQYTAKVDWPEGVATLYVQGRDAAYNWSLPTEVTTRIDRTPPAKPQLKLIMSYGRPSLSWQPVVGASQYLISVDDSLNLQGIITNATAFYKNIAFGPGNHVYTVRAQDSAGNFSDTSQVRFYLDPSTPPAPIDFKSNALSPSTLKFPVWTWKASKNTISLFRIRMTRMGDTPGDYWSEVNDTIWKPSYSMSTGEWILELQEGGAFKNWSPSVFDTIVCVVPGIVDSLYSGMVTNSHFEVGFHADDSRTFLFQTVNGVDTSLSIQTSNGGWGLTVTAKNFQLRPLSDNRYVFTFLIDESSATIIDNIDLASRVWIQSEIIAETGIYSTSLAILPNDGIIQAFSTAANSGKIQVKTAPKNTSDWIHFGALTTQASKIFQVVAAKDGSVHLLLADEGNGGKLISLKNTGTSNSPWTSTGLTTSFAVSDIQLHAMDGGGILALVKQTGTNTFHVYRSQAPYTTWVALGSPRTSVKVAAISSNKSGVPYLASIHATEGSMRFEAFPVGATEWKPMGASQVGLPVISEIKLHVDSMGIPNAYWVSRKTIFVQRGGYD